MSNSRQTAKRKTTGNTGTKRSSTKTASARNSSRSGKNSSGKKTQNKNQNSGIEREIGLVVLLLVCVFLFVSNFGVGGAIGKFLSGVLFGLFGLFAYLLPVLSMLQDGGYPSSAINCIIMSPTRELAQQIDQAMQGFSYYLPNVSSVAVYGGNDGIRYEQEKKSMQTGADIIIATPGRLISHISLGNVDLSQVSFFILDEADRMLDMGFSEDIMQIANLLPKDRQTILFSATMPDKIQQLAKTIMNNPVEVKLAVSKPAENIKQSAFICYEVQKLGIIKHLFSQEKPEKVIIFTGSKIKTKELAIALIRAGYNARAMHSDLSQNERDEVMYLFRSEKIDILVATDIVARGIDIDDIQLVINYDVPHDEEDYVHRIGRTARAGRNGRAITLVNEKDQPDFKQIERFLEKDIDKETIPEELGEGPEYRNHKNRGKGPRTKNKERKQDKKVSRRHNSRNTKEAIAHDQSIASAQGKEMSVTTDEEVVTNTESRKPRKPYRRSSKKHVVNSDKQNRASSSAAAEQSTGKQVDQARVAESTSAFNNSEQKTYKIRKTKKRHYWKKKSNNGADNKDNAEG